jgi:glycosyltransferase involved in cell wall biosynthesis
MEFASLRNGAQFFTSRKAREKENLACLRQLVQDYVPDGILVWGMWNLPRSLAALAEDLMPDRVVYYMGDIWPSLPSQHKLYWEAPPRHWWTAMPKLLLRPVARWMLARERCPEPKLHHVLFPSAFMRDELGRRGVLLQETKIIYGAIDTSLYRFRNGSFRGQQDASNLSLLCLGRLAAGKGVDTAIKALGILKHQRGLDHLKLTVVGAGDTGYEAYLRDLAQQENVQRSVRFLGEQPKAVIPSFYELADIFLFTSSLPESFGRVLVEAMASGVAVVGTATGGAAEILADNENALIFAAGDAPGLATQVARLAESPTLRERLVQAGRRTALDGFDIHRMVTEIEVYLQELVA